MRSETTAATQLLTIEARVREIGFQSPDSGYCVIQAKDTASERIITIVGEMPMIKVGDHLRFQGQWSRHARFGQQFRVQTYETVLPSTLSDIEAFLGSGLIKGIGPTTAKRMVAHFGEQTLKVLDLAPERLEEVPSIGARKREQIVQSWQERRGLQPIVQFLQQHGLAPNLGPRLYKEYGAKTLQILQSRPYDLIHLWGIGFETADGFARKIAQSQTHDWQPDQPERVQAGLKHVLQKAMRDGHLYLPLDQLLDQAAGLLGVGHTALVPSLDQLIQHQELYPEPIHYGDEEQDPSVPVFYDVYLGRNGIAEQQSAERLIALLKQLEAPDPAAFEKWLQDYQDQNGIQFAAGQRQAVQEAVSSKVFILTGGPGTGKTTVSKAILSWFKSQKLRFRLASPTGRAARRLAEVTGEEALTLHRLLEFDPHNQGFQRDESFPLQTDVVLLDEVSMVDMSLFWHLLRALPDKARLILIGDSDQLPSVGPGMVLGELLRSGVIPAVQLTEIYRQAQASRIVRNAHLVNHGQPPVLLPPTGRNRTEDAFFVPTGPPEQTLHELLELVAKRLPAAGHAVSDIQVLCPMKRGAIGTQALNAALQEALNPPSGGPELKLGPRSFRPGDRVIQLRNNYDHEIFNGDLGRVLQADGEQRRLVVSFSERTVEIDGEHLSDLDLAYALTIHKSQGAEFPVVVMVLTRQHHVMLQRNLLYTGMTRAQKLLILLGDPSAIDQAVRNDRLRRRFTRLGERLQNSLEEYA
ncbi:MAG TPA: ATP-dependent RecD-like DNA helicase [Candidatus Obscuribacterales bacterium]